jgi:hypothetical protein
LKDWELAIIFHVTHENGCIKLDQRHAPRVAPSLSTLPCSPQEDMAEEFRYSFKNSILRDYIGLMFKFGHSQLYPNISSDYEPSDEPIPHSPHGGPCHDPPVSGPKPEPCPWPCPRPDPPIGSYCPGGSGFTIDWALLWRLFIKETSLQGHHRITTVTQAGINAHFAAVWKKAKTIVAAPSTSTSQNDIDKRLDILTHFDSKKYIGSGKAAYLPQFTCECGAPQVELITGTGSKSVIVYFHIQKISFSLDNKYVINRSRTISDVH